MQRKIWSVEGGKKKKKRGANQFNKYRQSKRKNIEYGTRAEKTHLCMDSSTFLVRSSLRCLVFLFVSMNKSTKQNGYEHKLTCKEKGKYYVHILKKIE
jgi:hypothetical protein